MKLWIYILALLVSLLIVLIGVFIWKRGDIHEGFGPGGYSPAPTPPPPPRRNYYRGPSKSLLINSSTVYDNPPTHTDGTEYTGTYTVFDMNTFKVQADILNKEKDGLIKQLVDFETAARNSKDINSIDRIRVYQRIAFMYMPSIAPFPNDTFDTNQIIGVNDDNRYPYWDQWTKGLHSYNPLRYYKTGPMAGSLGHYLKHPAISWGTNKFNAAFNKYITDITNYYNSVTYLATIFPYLILRDYENCVLPPDSIHYYYKVIGKFGTLPFYFYNTDVFTRTVILGMHHIQSSEKYNSSDLHLRNAYDCQDAYIGDMQKYSEEQPFFARRSQYCNPYKGCYYSIKSATGSIEEKGVHTAQNEIMQTVDKIVAHLRLYNHIFSEGVNDLNYYNTITDIYLTPSIFRNEPKIRPLDFSLYSGIIPDWTPVLKLGPSSPAANILSEFMNRKDNNPAKYLWRPVVIKGSMTERNRDEIDQSISYAMRLNFSDNSLTERQIRISTNLRLYMSEAANGRPQFSTSLIKDGVNSKIAILESPDNASWNRGNGAMEYELTPAVLRYIPYHARSFIKAWATNRMRRVSTFTGRQLDPTISFDATPPIFNLLSPSIADINAQRVKSTCIQSTILSGTAASICDIPSAGLDAAGKKSILDKIAQCHYDNNEGKKRMLRIYDVFQIGDTIFDVRYSEVSKESQAFKEGISTLTNEYYKLRKYPLSENEFNNLELQFQQNVGELYRQEEANVTGGNILNCGTKARYIRVQAATLGKTIYLSQVIAIDNNGNNIAGNSDIKVANSTMVHLYPFELAGEFQTDYNGVALTGDDLVIRQTYMNNLTKQQKISVIADGVLTPKYKPSIYKSDLSTTTTGGIAQNVDFIEFDLGQIVEINAIQLIYPADDSIPSDVDNTYTVTLLDISKIVVGGPKITSVLSIQNPIAKVIFLEPNASALCPTELRNLFKTSRFYAKINPSQTAAPPINVDNITFIGFSEDEGLSFNPLYNCGYNFDLRSNSGNMNYLLQNLSFKLNVPERDSISCTDSEQLKNLLLEYRLSQQTSTFQGSISLNALAGNDMYENLDTAYYYPSSITASVQIAPYVCGIAWNELKVNKLTNQPLKTIQRYGKLVMTADTENWWSQRLNFNTIESAIFPTDAAYVAAGNPAMTPLTSPIGVPLPQAPKASLTTGDGVCPPKTCSDIDTINTLVESYNSRPENKIKIMRVNKAVTPYSNLCQFEVVAADYTQSNTNPVTVVSTMAMLVDIDTLTCNYKLISSMSTELPTMTLGSGFFVNNDTPFLSKIYTYAHQTLSPYIGSFSTIFSTLSALGNAQLDTGTGKNNITTTLQSYRSNTLASYGAIKVLDGCGQIDKPRCSDPAIINSFFNTYAAYGSSGTRLKSVLHAGTASGTECDFTFDMEDLATAATGPPVTGINPQTRGLRCRVEKLPGLGCEFAISETPYKTDEVFQVSSATNYSRIDSYNVCNAQGSRVATYNELAHASRMGASWSTPGWVVDMEGAYSIQNGSIVSATLTAALDPKYAVTCIGMKPADGTAGVGRFNNASYSMPLTTMGPCMEMMPNPSPDELADVGTRATTANLSADPSSFKVTNERSSTPYSIRTSLVSPLDYIDCASKYAIGSMGAAGAYPISTAGNIDQSTCVIKKGNAQQMFKFKKINGVYVIDGGGTTTTATPAVIKTFSPAVSAAPVVAVVTDCMATDYRSATGLSTLIQRGTNLNNTTCEYRITPRDNLPFSDTYKLISFYNDADGVSIASYAPSIQTTSKYVFQPPIRTTVQSANGPQAKTLIDIFKANFNYLYYTNVSPSNKTFRQRVGKVTSIGYHAAEDALILKGAYVTVGPLDTYDIRSYLPENIFKVIFRNALADNSTIVYSDCSGLTVPAGVTMYPVTTDTNDSIANDPSVVWRNRPSLSQNPAIFNDEPNKWSMLRFRVLDTALPYYEIFRLNLYTYDPSKPIGTRYSCSITNISISPADVTRASVFVTDNNGTTPLYINSYINLVNAPCNQYYNPGIDPTTNISSCTLDLTRVPQAGLYTFPKPSPNASCPMGYSPGLLSTCVLNNNFQDLIQNYCTANPSTAVPRLRIYRGQVVIINLNQLQYIHAYNIVTGAGGREPAKWVLEGSIGGGRWVTIHDQTGYTYTTPVGTPRQFMQTPLFKATIGGSWGTSTWPTIPQTIPADPVITVPNSAVEGFQVSLPEMHFTQPAIRPPPMREPLYRNPMQITPDHLVGQRRIAYLRFRTLETWDPVNRYVNMSMFRLYSATAPISTSGFKFSNLEGSRRLATEGPEALAADTPSKRWVDFNKSPLIIRIDGAKDMPEAVGFRFFIPTVSGSHAGLPVRWRLEGSYDGRSWDTLHDMSNEKATYLSNSTTVYKFSKPI